MCAKVENGLTARKLTNATLSISIPCFSCGQGAGRKSPSLPHHPTFDDVSHVPQHIDVEQRVTVHDDDVGELAGLDGA